MDLDGTLALYDEWVDELHIGPPIPAMVDRVKAWLALDYDVRVFTARIGGQPRGTLAAIRLRHVIEDWCLEHIGAVLPITNVKDYEMLELWDDRAVQVEKNTGRIIGQSTRGL